MRLDAAPRSIDRSPLRPGTCLRQKFKVVVTRGDLCLVDLTTESAMTTSISTPASLATFSQPHASSSKLPHVTLNPVEGGDDLHAVAAVQGDGVWTYDVSPSPSTGTMCVRAVAELSIVEDDATHELVHRAAKYHLCAPSHLVLSQDEGKAKEQGSRGRYGCGRLESARRRARDRSRH